MGGRKRGGEKGRGGKRRPESCNVPQRSRTHTQDTGHDNRDDVLHHLSRVHDTCVALKKRRASEGVISEYETPGTKCDDRGDCWQMHSPMEAIPTPALAVP